MPLLLQFEIEGEKQFSRRLSLMADGVEDFTEPLEKVEGEVMKSFDRNFAARGGLFGGWPPPAKNYGHPLLEKTGEMRGAFVSVVSSDSVEFGNPTSYFKYHQSKEPRSKIPRRVMMKLDQQRRTFIVKAFQAYLIKLTGQRDYGGI